VAIYPRRAAASEPLPSPLPLWERWAGGYRRVADAELLPGTELERLRFGGRVEALVVRRSGGADEADRRSAWRSWARERDWAELARRLGIPDLERLTVTRRGVSGRVVEMAAHGSSGSHRLLEGFPIRRSLDLPENLFSMHVLSKPDGGRVVRFLGRGWGHGVGLCQNGSYGLARAGRSFDQILGHYYSGIEILRHSGSSAVGSQSSDRAE
jgi:peptidoglycan hydrolase-like amidase